MKPFFAAIAVAGALAASPAPAAAQTTAGCG